MKNVYRPLAVILSLFTIVAFFGSSGGRAGAADSGNTGGPGETFTCGNCHNSASDTYGIPGVSVSVAATLGGPAVTEYIPGQAYFVTTTITATGSPAAYGFQSMYLNSANTNAGTLSEEPGEPTTQVATISSGRTYAEHAGRDADGVFRFRWTAPAMGTGTVTIYTAGNAVNGASGTFGDSGTLEAVEVMLTEAALPAELTTIDARAEKKTVELTWVTATEDNVSHFEVERSTDGEVFNFINQVSAQGNSQVERGYNHMDEGAPIGLNLYRLKIVDLDGTFAYSPVVSAMVETTEVRLGVFPNPTQAMVRFSNDVTPETRLILRDGFGRQVWSGKAANGIDLSPYPTGVYLLEALIDGQRTIERVVKQ